MTISRKPHGRHRIKRQRRHTGPLAAIAAALVAVFVVAAGCAESSPSLDAAAEPDETTLEAAKSECAPTSTNVTVGDGGSTLLIDHQGEDETTGVSIEDVACLLVQLQVPDSVMAQMDSTRALDGRQSADFGDLSMSWSYHPDTGIDMIVTEG